MNSADEVLSQIIAWAQRAEPIRALILVGSRAGREPTDELADCDVSVFTETPEPYTQSDQWLTEIGPVWVYIPEKYYRGGEEIPTRLVIFQDGVKVDFAFLRVAVLDELPTSDELAAGYRVLLDKDGRTAQLRAPTFRGSRPGQPTEEDFTRLVHEFWFEAYHVAKYLKRDDLWLVKFRDWTTKELLLKMLEWHAQAKHQWTYDTYHLGKQMKSWVEAPLWESLHGAFAHFDADDSWQALLATIELFRRVARETAALLGFAYPQDVDQNITQFIRQLKEGSVS
jgi:aminoglycoside 6-adenylyltransferase